MVHEIPAHVGENPLFPIKEELYKIIGAKIGEDQMTVDKVVQEINEGTGEVCIQQLQAGGKTPDGFSTYLGQIVPGEVRDAILKYGKK